jgi:SAM-dependent methyltransferase
MGAGSGHLTKLLLAAGLEVDAVEPNDAMRAIGEKLTAVYASVRWMAATAEQNGLPDASYRLVTFGSSFNVTDRRAALRESARILQPGGWFACMWNHRDLTDPLQAEIEALIRSEIPGYVYGARREDQTPMIQQSGLFQPVIFFEAGVKHRVRTEDWIDAWRSHATLARQAGERFADVVEAIGTIVRRQSSEVLEVPYITRVWAAQVAVDRV